jgi:hypothetical protein
MTTVNGNSGSQAMTVPYSSRDFYLYNNAVELDDVVVPSSCVANYHWSGSSCVIDTHTVTGSAGSNGTISPATTTVNYGGTTTLTVTPNTGYTASASGCGGSLSGTTYTTGAITADCTVTANFTINTYTVTGSAGANGTISPATRTVNYNSTTTFTVTPNSGYTALASGCGGSLSGITYTTGAITSACIVTATFTNTSCANGATNFPTCTTCATGYAMISSTCTLVTTSVTASPLIYNTVPSTNVPFAYTASTNTGSYECRLLDNTSTAVTSYAATNPIQYAPPSTPGSYGYYVQCRNTVTTTATTTSALITANVITTSVTASPTTYNNIAPSSNVSFTYTPTTNIGATECRLLDNTSTALTSYQASSPIIYAAPASVGAYGYYVQCRNTSATTALATSALITVNVAIVNVSPSLSSPTVSSITTTSANIGATVSSLGIPATISSRGTCWGTSPSPTTNCTAEGGTTTGAFSQVRSAMTPGTTYYYRGYAVNTTGTGYSPDGTFTTTVSTGLPDVENPTSTSTSQTAATIGAELVSLGTPASVSVDGFCYGTSPNPTTNCTPVATQATPPAIGNSYGGGIVYYILQSGDPGYVAGQTNGLIAATTDQSSNKYWHASNSGTTGTSGQTAIGLGNANTNAIVALYGAETNSARLCYDLNQGGQTDWYLPSTNELTKLYQNKAAAGISNFTAGAYWASVEVTSANGARVDMSDGNIASNSKSVTTYGTRCIRSFSITPTTITTGVFNLSLSSLTPNTTYYYRGYATNGTGTGYSVDGTFVTATTGTISASGCTISVGQTGCNTILNWNTINPTTTSIVKNGSTTVTTANQGVNYPYSIPSGVQNFILWHNGVQLATASATAVCANTTHWDGTKCIVDAPTAAFTATPSTIFKGKSSVLTWSSPSSDSCAGIGFNTGGAVTNLSPGVTVSPLVTTTYTLRCTNGGGSTDSTVVTKVITLQIKEN